MIETEIISYLAREARIIRKKIIEILCASRSGHPGGSLSIVELLTVLYFYKMNIRPKDPDWPDRDRLVLSKGHSAPALYATLAERGYFSSEELKTHRRINSRLQGHPSMTHTPGVDMSTGSLGQGLSAANGMAFVGKMDHKDYRVYVILGCGETQSGQIWEAAMASAHFKLDNLTAFLDYNKLQIDGPTNEVMKIEPVYDKWTSFGWNVLEIDGHDIGAIIEALERASEIKNVPTMIVAHTIKGKGVSFMEGAVEYHAKPMSDLECEKALRELDKGTREDQEIAAMLRAGDDLDLSRTDRLEGSLSTKALVLTVLARSCAKHRQKLAQRAEKLNLLGLFPYQFLRRELAECSLAPAGPGGGR